MAEAGTTTPGNCSDLQVYRTTRRTSRRYTPIGSPRALRTPTSLRSISETHGNRGGVAESLSEQLNEDAVTMSEDEAHDVALATGRVISTDPLRRNGGLDPEDPVLIALQRTIERQSRQLRSKNKTLERIKEDLSRARQQYSEAEKDIDQRDEEIAALRKSERQYRNWWLNEIQFTKLLLNKFPEPNRDIELVRASQAHYLGHY
ncbi:hypothetical protein BKA70DRAFT_1242913 [Coprinopsis sp. MPI-PUGE-AT-0042]|nr:hypothetical protein BKA70DRAFT_1242913 [Coprinopsis sp. MPI-PUGE-AT-0042]